ncbi:MAG: hypothetical protein U7126_15155 [Microcoleus sp.]
MFHNYNPQDGQWYAKHSLTAIALSALAELNPAWAECIRSLLQEKDETIEEMQQEQDDLQDENLELQQEVDSLKDENLELRQRVDPLSPDCLSIEDSFDEEY